jgi:hypothetical protein
VDASRQVWSPGQNSEAVAVSKFVITTKQGTVNPITERLSCGAGAELVLSSSWRCYEAARAKLAGGQTC